MIEKKSITTGIRTGIISIKYNPHKNSLPKKSDAIDPKTKQKMLARIAVTMGFLIYITPLKRARE